MEAQGLTKEAADAWMRQPGEVRGLGPRANLDYVEKVRGSDALRAVERVMEEASYPFPRDEIRAMRFYPIGYTALVELAINQVLDPNPEELVAIGRYATKMSIFVKVMLKFFVSIKTAVSSGMSMWGKYFTVGSMRATEVDEEKRRIVLRVEGIKITEPGKYIVGGYFAQTAEMITGKPSRISFRPCSGEESCLDYTVTW